MQGKYSLNFLLKKIQLFAFSNCLFDVQLLVFLPFQLDAGQLNNVMVLCRFLKSYPVSIQTTK